MSDRQVRLSTIRGLFPVPIGVRVTGHEPGEHPRLIEVSTVCLEGGHLEDPMGMVEPEHGYETMVFFKGCSLFGIYQQHYKTRAEAVRGHKTVVRKLLAGKLPLAINLAHYIAREEVQESKKAA